MPAVDPE
jgi:hypothetical protein